MALVFTWLPAPMVQAAELAKPAAVPPAATLPAAKDVVNRFVREIGGAAAFQRIDSQRMTGRFEMTGQGITGQIEVLAKRPDKMVMKMTLPGMGDMVQGYDGKIGWSLNPVTGPMLLEGKMLDQVREQARFDAVLHPPGEFSAMETVGKAQFEGKDAYQLKLVRKSGQEVTEYYDIQSGLLLGSSELQETPLGSIPVAAVVGEYKKFGDVLFATKLVQKMGPLAQVMTFEKMDLNSVDDSTFELPAQIKALVPK